LIALCVLFGSTLTNAQTAVYSENFNGCALPTGWTTVITSGVNDWVFGDNTGSNIDGSCMAYFDDDAIGSGAAFSTVELYSPFYDMSAQTTASVVFDYNFLALGNSFFAVDIWDKNTSSWVNILNQTTTNCGFWGCVYPDIQQDITSYLSDSVQMRFTYDDGDTWAWFAGFDNFALVFFPPNDVGVTDVTAPEDGCFLSSTETVTVDVYNYGSVDADTVELSLWVDGNFVATETWLPNPVIPPFTASSYTFTATANLAAAGTHDIQVSANFPGSDASTLNDTLMTQVTKTVVDTFPYVEDFDAWTTCNGFCANNSACAFGSPGWTNVTDVDDDDWEINTGGTGSFNTGPTGDHTSGAGNYLYTETSGCNGNEIIAETPCFNLTGPYLTTPALTFWYHMFGAAMGTLSVEINDGSGWENAWSLSGNQGDQWTQATVPLNCYFGSTIQIRFVGNTGTTFTSDMAIDDVVIDNYAGGVDAGVSQILEPTQQGCDSLGGAQPVTVNVVNTGTTTLNGIQVSLFVNSSLVATETIGGTFAPCADTNYTFIATANLAAIQSYNITATVTAAGDINGLNDTLSVTIANPGAPISSYPYLETFDLFPSCGAFPGCADGACQFPISARWVNPLGDTDDWDLLSGSTGSFNTGPSFDHTSGFGNYLYTETSGCANKNFYVESPCFDFSPLTIPQVSFWYHMFGATMGTMSLEIDTTGAGNWIEIWSLTGDQTDLWQEVKIPLFGYANTQAKFRMRGQTGTSFTSDMAFDDFKVGELPQLDVQAMSLVSPQSAICSFLSNAESVMVEYQNVGADTLDSISLALTIDGNAIVTDVITGSWLPGTVDTHTFSVTPDLSTPAFYDIQVTASALPTDDDFTNDDLQVEIENEGQIQNFPALETFDGFSNCDFGCQNDVCDTAFTALGWNNIPTGDNIDWSISNTLIPNFAGPTGPSADHTSGSGKFLVVNSQFCAGPTTATAESPCYDLSQINNPQVSFWYHMFGANMGTIQLQIDSSGQGNYTTIWTLSGDQGNSWQRAKVNLNAYQNKVVRFRINGILPIGFFNASNMAVDDFMVREIFSYDGTPVGLTNPVDTACALTSTETVTVLVENVGADTIMNPTMTMWVNGTFVATENWTATLLPDDIQSYTFTATADLSAPIQHDVTIAAVFSNDQFTGNDTTSFAVGRAPISNYPFVETFDTFDLCNSFCNDGSCGAAFTSDGWTNLTGGGDADDWSIGTGATGSFGTGPNGDHTTGQGQYLFVETSGCNNNQLSFETPCFDLSPLNAPNVVFWYHMFGPDIGTLELQVDNGTGYVPVWSLSGDQGNNWLPANISLSQFANQVVRFRMVGVSGGGFQGDFAIDDFGVQEAPPFDVQPLSLDAPQVNGCDALTANETVTITILNSGADTATNISATLSLNFATVVTDVIPGPILPGATYTHTFSQTIDLSPIGAFNIGIEATITGDAFTSNDFLSVDGLNDGGGTITTFPYSENFDAWNDCLNFCTDGGCAGLSFVTTPGWKNASGDDMDWSINSGATGSFNTGPSGDHTTGGGKYVYTETSGCNNQEGWVETPCFDFTNLYAPEVTFWYHMFGASMGTMELQADTTGNNNWATVWSLSGDQTDNWFEATVNLQPYAGYVTKLRFRAITGGGFTSDMAFDDFSIKDVVPHDLQVTSLNDLDNGCGDDSLYVDVTMYNAGFNDEDSFSVTVEMTGPVNTTITETYTTVFLSETSRTESIGPFNTSGGGNFNFKVYTSVLGGNSDFVNANDTMTTDIIATQLSTVSGNDASNCGDASLTLNVTGDATEYFWYNNQSGGNFIHAGSSFNTPVLSDTTTYWVEGRNPFFASIGKPDTVGNGAEGDYYDYFPDGLKFNAFFDLTVERLTIYPRLLNGVSNADIQVNIKDANGTIIGSNTITFWGTVGDTTVELNVDVPKGNGYTIDAEGTDVYDVEMYRNGLGGGAYPFDEPGAMRITGPLNNLGSYYYFFYNIEIQYLGCPSPRIPVTAFISQNTMVLDSTATVSDAGNGTGTATVTVSGGAAPYSYAWNTTPVQTTATATGLLPGNYTVTITDAAGCTSIQTVTVGTVGTNNVFGVEKFNLYPNPTSGLFTIDLELDNTRDVQIEIFNAIGQIIYSSEEEKIDAKQYALDLSDKAAGIYQVRVRVDDKFMTKKLLIKN
jgi:hypothetical protein